MNVEKTPGETFYPSLVGKEDFGSESHARSSLTEVESLTRSLSIKDESSSTGTQKTHSATEHEAWQPYLSLDNKARRAVRDVADWPVAVGSDDFKRFEALRNASGIQPCAMQVNSPAVGEFIVNLMERARGSFPNVGFNPGKDFTVAAQINGEWHTMEVKTGKSQLMVDGNYIYVRMLNGEFRVSTCTKNGNNAHAQLAGYAWEVAAAGAFKAQNGQIKEYSITSGTYQPSEELELQKQAAMPEQAQYITQEEEKALRALAEELAKAERNEPSTSDEIAKTQETTTQTPATTKTSGPVQSTKPPRPKIELLRERSITSEINLERTSALNSKRSRFAEDSSSEPLASNGEPHASSNELPEHIGENSPVPVVIDFDRRINP